MQTMKLPPRFRKINWGPVGEKVYKRTYSRVKSDGTKETWPETVERVVDGNLALVDKKFWKRNERRDLIELFLEFKALPAGRHLWVSGVQGRQFLFNCHMAHWRGKLSDHFAFMFDELMKGGGVGSNYSNRFIKRYSPIKNELDVHFVCDPTHDDYEDFIKDGVVFREGIKESCSPHYCHEWGGCIAIEDSREGWVNCLVAIIDAAHGSTCGPLVFDVSRIRAYGSPIKSFGGKASGPAALIRMGLNIARQLNERVGHKLNSLDYMLMDHNIACCVVAGNVRRSARMSVKHWKDSDIFDFIDCKSDKAHVAHWTTNVSVEVDNAFFRALKNKDSHALKVYETMIESMYYSGEPGFWNSSLSQHGETEEVVTPNPCGEIIGVPFENCNLGHINLGAFAYDPEGATKAFRSMTRFLIRATFGDIQNEWQSEVVRRNRRIGVGFTGFQDWLCLQGIKYSECAEKPNIRAQLRKFYQAVKDESVRYSHKLRIPAPIKVTTIAPTGTTSKLIGSSEGAQALIAAYFELRTRYQNDDPEVEQLKAEGYEFETCVNKEEGVNTIIVKHVCKHPLVDKIRDAGLDAEELVEGQSDVSLYNTLAIQAMLQEVWADNAISLTANLRYDTTSKKELYHTIMKFLPRLKGTTVYFEGGRPQPLYTPISREEYEKYHGIKSIDQGIRQCKNNSCPIK